MKKVKIKIPDTLGVKNEFIKLLQAETQGINTLGYKYVFDDSEKKSLEKELTRIKNTGPEKIQSFIESAERYCSSRKIITRYPKKYNFRENKERIVKSCQDTLGYLNRIEKGEIWLTACDKIFNETQERVPLITKYRPEDYGFNCLDEDQEAAAFFYEAIDRAASAIEPLKRFMLLIEGQLKAETRKRGRAIADSSDFVINLAETYTRFISKPTKYTDGPFYAIVRTCLDAIGLPSSDPSRAIKAALKALSKPMTKMQ